MPERQVTDFLPSTEISLSPRIRQVVLGSRDNWRRAIRARGKRGPVTMTSAVAQAPDASLVRSELTGAGIRRRRSGRGFRYYGSDGTP